MEPINPSNPSRDNNRDRRDDSEGGLPTTPRPAYHRLLVDTYRANCKRSFPVERVKLITRPRDMLLDDQVALNRMKRVFIGELTGHLTQLGRADEVRPRFLYPVVSVAPSGRCYHWYVDTISHDGRCVLINSQSVVQFDSGPASLHLTGRGSSIAADSLNVRPVLSPPAFREAIGKLITTDLKNVRRCPSDFVAFGWIMDAISDARRGLTWLTLWAASSPAGQIDVDCVQDFSWLKGTDPATFDCVIEGISYMVKISLCTLTLRPKTKITMKRA